MLIALAHGSRNLEWRRSVERQFELLQTELGSDSVQLAYMELAPPSLMDVVEAAVQHGVKSIRVLPLFLAAEGHVIKDIEPLVKHVRESFDGVVVELLAPVGQHPTFRDLIRTIALQDSP